MRHGHLCQFAYVARLLGLSAAEVAAIRGEVLAGRREAMYGVVRASFGISNRVDDVLRIGDALEEIAATPQRKAALRRTAAGEWIPKGLPPIDAASSSAWSDPYSSRSAVMPVITRAPCAAWSA